MIQFLRKIFFWDNPAKGAFLHATLMLAVPWCLFALLCFWLSFLLTLPSASDFLEDFGLLSIMIPFCGALVVFAIEGIAVCVCLGRVKYLLYKKRLELKTRRWVPVCLKLLTALCWLSADGILWLHIEFWTAYVVPAVAFVVMGYVCLGCYLKCFQKDIVGKGVLCAWGVVAIIWIVSMCMAVSAKFAADRHCEGLERKFGRSPTCEARDARIARECRIDADFWRKVHDILQRRREPETGWLKCDDSDNEFYVGDILDIRPSFMKLTGTEQGALEEEAVDILWRYRKQLTDFADLPELEKMLNEPLPLLLHEDYIRMEIGDSLRKVFHCEMWRLHFALADKEIETVMAVIRRMDNILECCAEMDKYSFDGRGWSYERYWYNCIEALISSPLLTDGQLAALNEMLKKRESACKAALDGMAYWIAIQFNNQFQMDAEDFQAGEPLPVSYPVFYLLHSLNECYWEKTTVSRQLEINIGRILLPQFWWFSANDRRIVFKMLTEFPDTMPEFNCGSLLIRMAFNYDWIDNMYFGFLRTLATNRALRCLIDAVLEYRRTGTYPLSLQSVPDDPYTGEPLKYCVGECLVRDYEKKKNSKIQAVQIWSVGNNKTDDDGLDFTLPDDVRRNIHRDDIRILIPLPPHGGD